MVKCGRYNVGSHGKKTGQKMEVEAGEGRGVGRAKKTSCTEYLILSI